MRRHHHATRTTPIRNSPSAHRSACGPWRLSYSVTRSRAETRPSLLVRAAPRTFVSFGDHLPASVVGLEGGTGAGRFGRQGRPGASITLSVRRRRRSRGRLARAAGRRSRSTSRSARSRSPAGRAGRRPRGWSRCRRRGRGRTRRARSRGGCSAGPARRGTGPGGPAGAVAADADGATFQTVEHRPRQSPAVSRHPSTPGRRAAFPAVLARHGDDLVVAPQVRRRRGLPRAPRRARAADRRPRHLVDQFQAAGGQGVGPPGAEQHPALAALAARRRAGPRRRC